MTGERAGASGVNLFGVSAKVRAGDSLFFVVAEYRALIYKSGRPVRPYAFANAVTRAEIFFWPRFPSRRTRAGGRGGEGSENEKRKSVKRDVRTRGQQKRICDAGDENQTTG